MGAKQRTERENQILVAAGFTSTDQKDDLWTKDGVYWFGRSAAHCRVYGARCAGSPVKRFPMRSYLNSLGSISRKGCRLRHLSAYRDTSFREDLF
jgi:hypothetical protein